MKTLSNFFAAVAALFTWKARKLEADNSPAMQANATARTDQGVTDAATKAVATDDLDAIRKGAAE